MALSVASSWFSSAVLKSSSPNFPSKNRLRARRPAHVISAPIAAKGGEAEGDLPKPEVHVDRCNPRNGGILRRPRRFDLGPTADLSTLSPMRTMRQMLDMVDRMMDDELILKSTTSPTGEMRMPWDVEEDEGEVRVRLDVPGFSKEELKVSVDDDDVLTVKGEQRSGEGEEQRRSNWCDRRRTSYNTQLILPDNCDKENIRAELRHGVLFITVPKIIVQTQPSRVIDVQVN